MTTKRIHQLFASLIIGASLFAGAGASAQTTINTLTDSIYVIGPWTLTGQIIFNNTQPRYTPGVRRFGIQVHNGQYTEITNPMSITNLAGSPIIGAHGQGTLVEYNGVMESNGGRSFPSLVPVNGGVVKIGARARTNLVLPGSFFTRQFWCYGDGTGTIEFDSLFVADHTNLGTVADGLGSIRLSNCRLLTHSTRSLPKGYRPNGQGGVPLINAHLVFDDRPGSVWIVASQPQEYVGGLWVMSSFVTVETHQDLNLPGRRSIWSDYINWGGLIYQRRNALLTKRGDATLNLTGDQGYADSSTMHIKGGKVRFKTPPADPVFATFYNANNGSMPDVGANLHLVLDSVGTAEFDTSAIALKSLKFYSPTSKLIVGLFDTIRTDTVQWGGILEVKYPTGFDPNGLVPTTLNMFRSANFSGQWSRLVLPTLPSNLEWDTTLLVTTGQLIIRQTTSIASMHHLIRLQAYPNPAKDLVTILLPPVFEGQTQELTIVGVDGKRHQVTAASSADNKLLIKTDGLPTGLYQLIIKSGNQTGSTYLIVRQ